MIYKLISHLVYFFLFKNRFQFQNIKIIVSYMERMTEMFISNNVEITNISEEVNKYINEHYENSLLKTSKVIVVRYKGKLMVAKVDKKYKDKLKSLDFKVITDDTKEDLLNNRFSFVMLWIRKPIEE